MDLVYSVPGLLAAIVLHELGHGLAATALGDPTPRLTGRLTLNPVRHLDPIGLLMLWAFHFGWAKPVQVNPSYFADPRRGMMAVSLAGPGANMLVALLALVVLVAWQPSPRSAGEQMLAWTAQYNVWLGLFNLVPVPPLDGSKVLGGLLPPRREAALSRLEPYGWLILILLLSTGLAGRFLAPAADAVLRGLVSAARGLVGGWAGG